MIKCGLVVICRNRAISRIICVAACDVGRFFLGLRWQGRRIHCGLRYERVEQRNICRVQADCPRHRSLSVARCFCYNFFSAVYAKGNLRAGPLEYNQNRLRGAIFGSWGHESEDTTEFSKYLPLRVRKCFPIKTSGVEGYVIFKKTLFVWNNEYYVINQKTVWFTLRYL